MSDAINRKQRAEALLADPMINEAFDVVEREIMVKLKGPATTQDAEWLMALRLMPKIKGWFIQQINNGKIEEFDARQQEKKK